MSVPITNPYRDFKNDNLTNSYFRNTQVTIEQDLVESMIIEAIKIFGEDMYYVIRKLNSEDKIFGEDDTSSYETAVRVEMYVNSVDGFGGDGNFMSKFQIEIRDQITFTISKYVFDSVIGTPHSLLRPNEGDLVYFPLNNKVFQIKQVANKSLFYQLGKLYTYVLTCELFEYSGEQFSTGIAEIDSIQDNLSLNVMDYTLGDDDNIVITTEDDNIIVDEDLNIQKIDPAADNDSIQDESDDIMDFSEIDPFSKNGNY